MPNRVLLSHWSDGLKLSCDWLINYDIEATHNGVQYNTMNPRRKDLKIFPEDSVLLFTDT